MKDLLIKILTEKSGETNLIGLIESWEEDVQGTLSPKEETGIAKLKRMLRREQIRTISQFLEKSEEDLFGKGQGEHELKLLATLIIKRCHIVLTSFKI